MNGGIYYNPVRWVCQRDKCEGWYSANGEHLACPIYEKCQASGGRGPQLEYLYPRKNSRTTALHFESDLARRAAHDKRRNDIMRAFGWKAEDQREYRKRHPEKQKEQNERQAEKRKLESLMRPKPPRANIPPPPCGGDCEDNCPYDGDCRYPDWEEENDVYVTKSGKIVNREVQRRQAKICYEKKKAKREADPEFDASEREKIRCRSCKRYYKNKFLAQGFTQEEYERVWTGVGGTPEGMREAWKRAGKSAAQLVATCAWDESE